MRKVSAAVSQLLAQLGSAQLSAKVATLCDAIAEHGESAALSSLLSLLLDERKGVAAPVRRAAERLLLKTQAHDLGWLEQDVRLQSRRDFYETARSLNPWQRLRAEELFRLAQEPDSFGVIALSSFHHSGYVREAAVQILDGWRDGRGLPFLLLRANDWVAEVQRTAQAAIRKRLLPEYAAQFLQCIALCDRLAEQRRNDLSTLRSAIRELLKSHDALSVLYEGLTSPDRRIRRASFVLAAESPAALRGVLQQGLRSDDLWVRIWAAKTARTQLYGDALRETLGQAKHDRSSPVRREALMAFVEDYPELRASLFDPSPGLREMVRFYLRKVANLDFAALYLRELQDTLASSPSAGERIAVAVSGVSETAGKADGPVIIPILIPLLRHPRAKIRSASLAALGRLDTENHLFEFSQALLDPSSRVVRTALQALGSQRVLVHREIIEAFRAHENPRCRLLLLKSISGLSHVRSLYGLLLACQDHDLALVAHAQVLLLRWLARAYSSPLSTEERTDILRQLACTKLPASLKTSMEQRLRTA